MKKLSALIISTALLSPALQSQAQPQSQAPSPPALQTSGALIVVPAFGEVKAPNDEARLTLMVEEQDKDKAAAASRVNRKMKEGTAIVRRADSGATLKTRGYFTYPVYADEAPQPRAAGKQRQLIGWRVGQYLDVTTTSLEALPKTVAAAQGVLTVQGLHFGLSSASARKLDEQRIAAAYRDLSDRIAAVARAMGRTPGEAVLELVDFEASGSYAKSQDAAAPMMMRATAAKEYSEVEEPSFEPGETTLQMRVVGKIRFR
jgi:uncharacterized protein YggE